MGSVPNVGLMAQAAEEYGSHDKTFEIPVDGTVRVTDDAGAVVFDVPVAAGDIFRMCQTKDVPIRDWVKLAVTRARATGDPAVFWLDEGRAHDANLIAKVREYLAEHDTDGPRHRDPGARGRRPPCSLERIRRGENTISVTGNVLRDYLTDLFPIMELGTSAKMLSIVPAHQRRWAVRDRGRRLGPEARPAAPAENYLRWDSLGEFLALAVSFEHLAQRTGNSRAQVLADTLDRATGTCSTRTGRPAASSVASTTGAATSTWPSTGPRSWPPRPPTPSWPRPSPPWPTRLAADEDAIVGELLAVQGSPADIGGYYLPDDALAAAVMRPSATFNEALATLG